MSEVKCFQIKVGRGYQLLLGSTRAVLLVADVAVKVPCLYSWRQFLLGIVANLREREFASAGWPELCPVLWTAPLGLIVVMRRARPLTRKEFDQIDLEKWMQRPDYIIPAEPKMDSFGWLDGRLVAVDYGN